MPTPVLYSIAYSNKHSKPEGWPVMLCELFLLDRPRHIPDEIANFPYSLGSGYSLCIGFPTPPSRQLSHDSLANVRKKRLKRRVEKKTGFFADHFYQAELERKPDYYSGITDANIQEQHDQMITREHERWNRLNQSVGVLIVYAQEPEEAKQRAAALALEMASIREKHYG